MKRKLNLPRAPLPRQKGGAHGLPGRRELSPREEVTLRLNEMAQEGELDFEELREMMRWDDSDDDNMLDDYLYDLELDLDIQQKTNPRSKWDDDGIDYSHPGDYKKGLE